MDEELKKIVANMVAVGESEENIAIVIQNYDSVKKKEQSIPASTPTSIVSKEVPKPLQENGTTTNSQVAAVDNYIANADNKLPTDEDFNSSVDKIVSRFTKPVTVEEAGDYDTVKTKAISTLKDIYKKSKEQPIYLNQDFTSSVPYQAQQDATNIPRINPELKELSDKGKLTLSNARKAFKSNYIEENPDVLKKLQSDKEEDVEEANKEIYNAFLKEPEILSGIERTRADRNGLEVAYDAFKEGMDERDFNIKIAQEIAGADDEEAKKLLELEYNRYLDQSQDIQRPQSDLISVEGISKMAGTQAMPIVNATIIGLIPAIGRPASILYSSGDAGTTSYGSAFRSTYIQARNEGKSDKEAYDIAKDVAKVNFGTGAIEGALGVRTSGLAKKLGGKFTQKFASKALQPLVDRAASGVLDIGLDASAAATGQVVNNWAAISKGLDTDLFDGVEDEMLGEIIFSVGMKGVNIPNHIETVADFKKYVKDLPINEKQKIFNKVVESKEDIDNKISKDRAKDYLNLKGQEALNNNDIETVNKIKETPNDFIEGEIKKLTVIKDALENTEEKQEIQKDIDALKTMAKTDLTAKVTVKEENKESIVDTKDFEAKLQDEAFIEKVANGDINVSIDNDTELGNRLNEKVEAFKTEQEITKAFEDDSENEAELQSDEQVETTKTNIDETESTGTTETTEDDTKSNTRLDDAPTGKEESIPEIERKEKQTGIRTSRLPITDIEVRPDVFQFKAVDEESGVNKAEKLEGSYDENLAGTIGVWVDTKGEVGDVGKTYVVDGHHRMEFAKRNNIDEMNVFYIDAPTANDAKVIAAKANIAQGRGTAIDAAKVFKASPESETKSFIPKSKVGRDGLALSNLSEPLFNLVVNGKLGVDRGVLLSQGKDATVQEAVYNEIKKVEGSGAIKMKNSTIKEYIDAGNSSNKTTETTVDLFGETEQEKVDISTRMNLLGTIRDKLISAKNIFGQAARNSDVLNKVGNKVNEEMNAGLSKDAAENIALFDAFKNTTILSKTINNAVDKYKEAKTRKEKTDITEKLYNDIIGIVTKEVGKESTTESKTAAEETKRERIDREIKETVNKMKGKLGSGGLQNIEEFVKLVSLYVEKGILNVQELIDRIRKDFPNEPFNTKMVDDALAIINANKNLTIEVAKGNKVSDGLKTVFNDYQTNGGTLSYNEFLKGLKSYISEQKKIKEQAKVEERKAETETILESKPKTKEDKIKKVALKLGLKTQQDLNKEVADLIKEYMVKGLLNDRQVKALTKRALGVKVGNLKSQTDFANFFNKVMNDVEYVNRLDRLNALDDLKRKVAKNVKKKIGFVSEKVNTILRLKDVPDNLIDEYESVLRNLGARETIIEVDMEALDKLHEKVLKELEVKDNSLSNEEELSDEQLEQLKELDKEIEEAKKQEAIEQYIELSEYVDVNEFDFNNDKVTRAAIQFASLPKAFLETLSSKQVVNIAKELVNLNNGFISNGLVVNTVLNYNGWVEAQNVLDSKNILNRKGTEDQFQEQTKKLESELKKEKDAAIKKGEKIAKKIEKKVADRMQQHIDSLIGGIKNTSIYEAIVSKVSSAEGAISDNNMREEANISKLLKAAVVSKIGNIKYRLGKTTKATYRLNTVIEFVLRQQEHLANPDNKKTPSLQELFNKMNEVKEKQADGSLGSDDFDIVEEVYNNISKYEKDGVIDIQSFIDNELTKEEQSLIEYIKDGYKRYEEKYVYLENMRGRTPEMTSEYSHRSSSMNDTDISSEEDAYKKMLGGGFKAGSVEKRIATVPLIKPLGISNFLSYINDVNTDFYLSPVVKELNSTFKHLKAEGNETTNSVAKTLQDLTKKNLKSTFIKQQVATINEKIWRTLVGNVAKKTLIALQRIPQETTNLLVFLPKIPKLIKNAKVNKEIRESGALDIIMEEYGTSQNERLNMIGRGTATADIKQMDMAKTLRKGLKTTNVSGKEKALDLLRNNILADIGEASMKAYYQFVDVALPYSFTTEFSSRFKSITGKDFDSQAFVNDKVYRAKNEIHIRRAIAQAQKDTSDLYNTASRFEGKIEGKDNPSSVKAMLSNFMQSFSFNEQSTLVSAGKSIFGKGSMSASEGWVKFMALTLRSILYDVIGKVIVNNITNALVDDEDEEVLDQDKMIKQAGGNYLMLALMGNLPAYQKVLLGTALNYTQEAYSKYYKKEEFDKDDQLFIGFNSTRGRDVMRMFGASGAIFIMADDILSKAIKLQEKGIKGEEITDKDIYELKVMVSLYDMVSVATGIPLYRDVKLLHKKLEAEQGVYQKFGAKKTGKYKKKVIKPISD